LIETKDVTRRFGQRVALAGVTLSIPERTIRLIVGPNGAGKTTLIRILATLTRPTGGTATIDGIDVVADSEAVRERIGIVLHEALLYPELTALENLEFYASLYGVDPGAPPRDALRLVGLLTRANDFVGTFSMGMRKRLAFARAILHRPKVLLLDEPLAGLDRDGTRVVTEFLRRLRDEGKTIVMTTHTLERDWALGDAVSVLHKGRTILERPVTPDGLPDFLADVESRLRGG
jgi:ABC-type multidrug transport system ATPase subunit